MLLPRGRALICIVAICLSVTANGSGNPPIGQALDRALRSAFRQTNGAAVVLSADDSRVLAAHNVPVLTRKLLTPGSTVKPFTLELLLRTGRLRASDRFACRRGAGVRGVRLSCSHAGAMGPFDADEALAFSCNSYFLEAARRLRAGELEQYLRQLGFQSETGLMKAEAAGDVSDARTDDERQLLAIGAAGVEVTPLELAAAYVRVARWRAAPTPSQQVVLEALEGSARYGLATLASSKSIKVAGKTGTASNRGQASTHGWFAGFAPADNPQIVVVVYVEQGRGSLEAAAIAHQVFEAWVRSR